MEKREGIREQIRWQGGGTERGGRKKCAYCVEGMANEAERFCQESFAGTPQPYSQILWLISSLFQSFKCYLHVINLTLLSSDLNSETFMFTWMSNRYLRFIIPQTKLWVLQPNTHFMSYSGSKSHHLYSLTSIIPNPGVGHKGGYWVRLFRTVVRLIKINLFCIFTMSCSQRCHWYSKVCLPALPQKFGRSKF